LSDNKTLEGHQNVQQLTTLRPSNKTSARDDMSTLNGGNGSINASACASAAVAMAVDDHDDDNEDDHNGNDIDGGASMAGGSMVSAGLQSVKDIVAPYLVEGTEDVVSSGKQEEMF
jgi:hypothetical protein